MRVSIVTGALVLLTGCASTPVDYHSYQSPQLQQPKPAVKPGGPLRAPQRPAQPAPARPAIRVK